MVASAAAVVLLAGCSADAAPDPTAQPKPDETPSAATPEPEPPTLRQVRRIVGAPVRFSYELTATDGSQFYSLTGIAHPPGREWTGTLEINDPTTAAAVDLRAQVKSIDDKLWIQLLDGGPAGFAGCWADVSAGYETLGTLEPLKGLPNAVLVLATLKMSNDRAPLPRQPFGASLSTRSAVGNVLPPRIALELDFEKLPRGSVPARVQVKGQSNVSIQVRGLDVSDSLIGLGGDVPKDVDRFLRATNVFMGVRPAANPPKILPPRDETLMSLDDVDANGEPVPCRAAENEPEGVAS